MIIDAGGVLWGWVSGMAGAGVYGARKGGEAKSDQGFPLMWALFLLSASLVGYFWTGGGRWVVKGLLEAGTAS